MLDAVVISDLHLGSDNCQADTLVTFLERVRRGDLPTRRLILNGDVFDSIDFRRLNKRHWKVLSLLRKMSDEVEIVWINGNHDGSAEIVSHLLGVTVRDEVEIESGGRRVLFLHGHQFDDFIDAYPVTTWAADWVYRLLQKIDRTHTFARTAKKKSKMFLRCARRIEEKSVAYARALGCDAVCCGHTHFADANTAGPVHYFNSGCWTETPCHYLAVADGVIAVRANDGPTPVPAEAGAYTPPELAGAST